MIQRLSIPVLLLSCVAACGSGSLVTTDFSGDNLRLTGAGLFWSEGATIRFLPNGSSTPETLATLPGSIADLTVKGEFAYVLHHQSPSSFAKRLSQVRLAGGGTPSSLVESFGGGTTQLVGVIGERVYYRDSIELRVVGQAEPVVSQKVMNAVVFGERILYVRVGEVTDEIVSVNADGGDEKVLFAKGSLSNGRLIPGSEVIAFENGFSSFWIPAAGGARGEFPARHIPLAVSGGVVFLSSSVEKNSLVMWEGGATTPLVDASVNAAVATDRLVYYGASGSLFSVEYR